VLPLSLLSINTNAPAAPWIRKPLLVAGLVIHDCTWAVTGIE
jgi:hypothetical protein